MPSVIVHKAAMEQCVKLCLSMGINNVIVGNRPAIIEPDFIMSSHGYSFETNTGSIIEKIISYKNEIRFSKISLEKEIDDFDLYWISKIIRYICHLTTDSFSVGQTSNELWGQIDNRLDFYAEFVLNKKKIDPFPLQFTNEYALINRQLEDMKIVHDLFKDKAKNWEFIISKDFALMVRNCVAKGAEYAFAWVDLAIKERGFK